MTAEEEKVALMLEGGAVSRGIYSHPPEVTIIQQETFGPKHNIKISQMSAVTTFCASHTTHMPPFQSETPMISADLVSSTKCPKTAAFVFIHLLLKYDTKITTTTINRL
jgi:hypothetical protein